MSNNSPSIDELRESFERVYHGPDRLRREYDLGIESERLGVHIDTYRRLYELRSEEEIDPYPKPKKWWHTPIDWGKWALHLPTKKKLALGRKGVVKLVVKVVQSGVILTVVIGIGRYVWEAPKREKLAHYQAWQMINSAAGQRTSGGRIEALQDLNKDGVRLWGLDVSGANLYKINLQKADIANANLSSTDLGYANLSYSFLGNVNFSKAWFGGANLSNTYLAAVNLTNADLFEANLTNANFTNVNLKGAKNITPEQIKQAKNWQSACYDPDFRIKLGLPPQNPKDCAGEKHTK